jgi:uncharacterized damage-inducible protein DinB
MSETARIADQLRRAYDGDPWHGSALAQILRGISAREASTHALASAHTIWETLLHIHAWTGEVRERLEGKAPDVPAMGDWPATPTPSEKSWTAAQAALGETVAALEAACRAFPEERLPEMVGGPSRDRAEGTGVSHYVLLHGAVQHLVYHSAQIATFKRILREGRG